MQQSAIARLDLSAKQLLGLGRNGYRRSQHSFCNEIPQATLSQTPKAILSSSASLDASIAHYSMRHGGLFLVFSRKTGNKSCKVAHFCLDLAALVDHNLICRVLLREQPHLPQLTRDLEKAVSEVRVLQQIFAQSKGCT
jgi:hypothetical protein